MSDFIFNERVTANVGVVTPATTTTNTGSITATSLSAANGYFSGNVGIGITTPSATLTVQGSVQVRSTNKLHFTSTLDRATVHAPLSDTLAISTAGSERLRIDSSGNVGIGTNSPATRLAVSGALSFAGNISAPVSDAAVYRPADGVLGFVANGSERLRITSGGEVYIAGTTDQGAYNLQVNCTGDWGA